MENILRLVSYNCRGMPRQSNALCNMPSLQLLLDDTENDIICVQETWYCDDVDNRLDNTCEVIRQETVLFSTPETDYIIYD